MHLKLQVIKYARLVPLCTFKTLKNVIIMGDSVSIGYAPKVQNALSDIALVQHSPWGGDGGAEETQYGFRCIEFLLRSPSGIKQVQTFFFSIGACTTSQTQQSPDRRGR